MRCTRAICHCLLTPARARAASAANVTVAEKLLQSFPSYAVLRYHATPAPQNFDDLVKAARIMGFELRTDTSKALCTRPPAATSRGSADRPSPAQPTAWRWRSATTTRCSTR